jgi:lipid-binding SYLF domain-containing protein
MDMRQTIGIAVTVFASAAVLNAAVTKTQAERLHDAAIVLHEVHRAPDKDIPRDLWEKASCVAVFPSVKKAAFIVGGEYGKGIMSCRNGAGWSAPSFMMLEKGSLGVQFGGETVDLVLLVMNERGVNRLLQDKVALGAEASIAGGPVGRDARAMTDAQLKAEILSYSRSQGIFAGVDLTGGVIKPDRDDNRDLYGQEISSRDILVAKRVGTPRAADEFQAALRRTAPPSE